VQRYIALASCAVLCAVLRVLACTAHSLQCQSTNYLSVEPVASSKLACVVCVHPCLCCVQWCFITSNSECFQMSQEVFSPNTRIELTPGEALASAPMLVSHGSFVLGTEHMTVLAN
jgi:hypothetical protein